MDPSEKGVAPIILEQHGIDDSIAFLLFQTASDWIRLDQMESSWN